MASIFLGGWIYEGILFGIQNNHKMHGIAACARCIVLQIKYHWTFLVILFNFLEIFKVWKFGILKFGNLEVNFWSRISLGFVESLRDYFGFWFLPWFGHPHHLKSGEPLWCTCCLVKSFSPKYSVWQGKAFKSSYIISSDYEGMAYDNPPSKNFCLFAIWQSTLLV